MVESTYNWYWLVDGLKDAGFDVKLANTVAMKRYDGLKHSDDQDDAAFLAHLLMTWNFTHGLRASAARTRTVGSGT